MHDQRIEQGFWHKGAGVCAVALVLALYVMSWSFCAAAVADEGASADAGAATASAGANANASAAITAGSPSDAASQSTYAFSISADARALSSTDPSFSISDYTLLPVGSTRPIEGNDEGLTFSLGDHIPSLMILTVSGHTLVYVDRALTYETDALRAGIEELDRAQSQHITTLSEDANWEFTSSFSYDFDDAGVRVEFGRELSTGHFYVCVKPVDALATESASSGASLTQITSLRFGELAVGDNTSAVHSPTALEKMTSFLGSIDYSPLWVTLKTTLTAIVIVFVLGLLAAYFSLHVSSRIRDIADSIFTIPMVLPPTVCGFVLLLALGRNTTLGLWFINIGFPLIFSWVATVIAAVVVAFPLMYRSARGAFESIDPLLLDAARTLGWSEPRIFFRLMLPLAWTSIASGTVLAFARALGEFGATLFLAGNYLGITRTIPIAIYFEWMNGNTDVAIFWTLVIIAVSFIVILFINLYGRRTQRYRMKGPHA